MILIQEKATANPKSQNTKHGLLEIFYKSLNAKNKIAPDILIGGAFMSLTWELASAIVNRITKTKRGWHRWESNVTLINYEKEASAEK